MTAVLLTVIALIAYAFGCINSPVFVSNRVFKKDVRHLGSRNASYANFIQVFGAKNAAWLIAADALKTVIPCVLGLLLMKLPGEGYPKLGALFAGFCCVLGDCYPWRYRFKGNMGVVCCAAMLWTADWRVGLLSCIFYVVALAFSRMVSLAGLVLAVSGPILCWCFVPYNQLRGLAGLMALFAALVICFRQRKAIRRIIAGEEARIRWGQQADDKMNDDKF